MQKQEVCTCCVCGGQGVVSQMFFHPFLEAGEGTFCKEHKPVGASSLAEEREKLREQQLKEAYAAYEAAQMRS